MNSDYYVGENLSANRRPSSSTFNSDYYFGANWLPSSSSSLIAASRNKPVTNDVDFIFNKLGASAADYSRKMAKENDDGKEANEVTKRESSKLKGKPGNGTICKAPINKSKKYNASTGGQMPFKMKRAKDTKMIQFNKKLASIHFVKLTQNAQSPSRTQRDRLDSSESEVRSNNIYLDAKDDLSIFSVNVTGGLAFNSNDDDGCSACRRTFSDFERCLSWMRPGSDSRVEDRGNAEDVEIIKSKSNLVYDSDFKRAGNMAEERSSRNKAEESTERRSKYETAKSNNSRSFSPNLSYPRPFDALKNYPLIYKPREGNRVTIDEGRKSPKTGEPDLVVVRRRNVKFNFQ